MNKLKFILPLLAIVFIWQGCTNNNLVDTNMAIDDNNWAYAKSVKTAFEIKEVNKSYQIYFKLRHTTAYRYSNLYVLMHLNGEGIHRSTRYQFKLAKFDGEWIGKGSGDIYTYTFPLLTDYRFTKPGKYEIEIEQNMRDNPLIGISDVGIRVAPKE